MKPICAVVLALTCVVTRPASGTVLGGSNLGPLDEYPGPKCNKPVRPIRPSSLKTLSERAAYDGDMEAYRVETRFYFQCINKYLENGQYDIERIKEKMKQVEDDAKRPQF